MRTMHLLAAAFLLFAAAAASVPTATADNPELTQYWVEEFHKPWVGFDDYNLTQESAAASRAPTCGTITWNVGTPENPEVRVKIICA